MHRWTLRKRILISFGLVIAVFVLVGWVANARLSTIDGIATELKERGVPAAYAIGEVIGEIHSEFATTVGYVLATDLEKKAQFGEQLSKKQAKIGPLMERLKSTSTEAEKMLFDDFLQAYKTYQERQKEALEAAADPTRQRVAIYVFETQLQDAYLEVIRKGDEVVKFKREQTIAGTDQVAGQISATKKGGLVAIGSVFLISALAATALIRGITLPMKKVVELAGQMSTGDFTKRVSLKREDEFGLLSKSLNEMADQLAGLLVQVQKSAIQADSSATQVASTAKQQQTTASGLAASTTEIGTAAKEISATSQELLNTVNTVVSVTEETAALANNGQTGLARMEETMTAVMDASASVTTKLAVLSEKATNINQVVTTIVKVANQTNLLSLNAAIEAEKAGEFGRGFSVVANEIRRLAEETAVATEEIETMVKETQGAVSAGIMSMDQFSAQVRRAVDEVQSVSGELSEIIRQVQTLRPRFEIVGEGMQAQTTGARQISEALGELGKAAKETSDSLTQSNRTIVHLKEAANGLRDSVSRFKL